MRSFMVVVALAVVSVTGCQRHSTLGWRFEVGRAGTVMVPMPIKEQSGYIDATPVSVQATPKMSRVDVRYCPPGTVQIPATKDVGARSTADCP